MKKKYCCVFFYSRLSMNKCCCCYFFFLSSHFNLFVSFRCHFRTVRVWLRRDSGQYWPSICQFMPSGCASIDYDGPTRQLFIGQENGTVSQYTLSGDCNSLTMVRDYLAHQARVTGVCYTKSTGWILSCGKDKLFSFHSTETTRRLGGYTFESMCTSLQYPFFQKQKHLILEYWLFVVDLIDFIAHFYSAHFDYYQTHCIFTLKR